MIVILASAVSAQVKIKGFVNDYAGIIDPAQEAQLNSILKGLYDSGAAEYAIVTVNSLEGSDIESYSWNIAEGNLGDKEKNNGLLLLVALEERKYRFEVGRGIEPILNDAKVGRIGRMYLVPYFQQGDYGTGIVEASKAIQSIMIGDVESEYYVDEGVDDYIVFEFILSLIIFVFIFLLPIIIAILKRRKFKNKYFDAAAGAIILFGGRGRSGGIGGGFGGFGGGSFGGGGASGGW